MENFGLQVGTALPTSDFRLNTARGLLSRPRRSRGTRASTRKMRAIRVLESLPYPPGSYVRAHVKRTLITVPLVEGSDKQRPRTIPADTLSVTLGWLEQSQLPPEIHPLLPLSSSSFSVIGTA